MHISNLFPLGRRTALGLAIALLGTAGGGSDPTALPRSDLSRERGKQVVEELRKKGMQVTELARDELPMIRMTTRKVVDKYARKYGEDWVKRLYVQLAVDEHRKLATPAK